VTRFALFLIGAHLLGAAASRGAEPSGRSAEQAITDVAVGVKLNSSSAGAANAKALNRWAAALGTTSDRRLVLPAGAVYLDQAWVISGKGSGGIAGIGGGADIFGANDPAATNAPMSRIVGSGLDRVIEFTDGAGGGELTGIAVWGYNAASRAEIVAHAADYADVGILIKDRSGQFYGDMLQLCACKVGIQCGEKITDQQTDNLTYLRLLGNHVGTLIKTVSQQSVNHTISELHAFGCGTVIHSQGSCDFEIARCYIGADDTDGDGQMNVDGTFLKVDYATVNSNLCHVGMLAIDGSMTDCMLLNMTAHSFAVLQVDMLRLCNSYRAHPAAVVRGAGSVVINGGYGLIEEMFECHEVSDGAAFQPTITVRNATMANGKNALKLVHPNSTGTCYVLIDGVKSYTGEGGPSKRVLQTWVDGKLKSSR
jgi:hypothetical protein